MKVINATELQVLDIFCFELKILDREAYIVLDKINDLTFEVESRKTSKIFTFEFGINEKIIYLKNHGRNLQAKTKIEPIQF